MMTAGGASFQGGYVYGTDPQAGAASIRRNLKRFDVDNGEKLRGVLDMLWNKYTAANDKIENASRLETFKKALEAGKPLAQALYESKDLMDYSLRGNYALVKYLSDITPFLNARVQGLYKLARAGKNGKKLMAWRLGQLALFSAALALWNIDDDEYNALPDWEKDAYWHIFGDDYHIRIPKPFEVGIIGGTFPERIVHVLLGQQENKKLWWTLKHNVMHTIGFEPIPHFMLPAVEVWANKSRFFKTPVVAAGDEQVPDPRASDTMVQLGKWIGVHPQKLEHLWNGYLGTMGMYALGISDMAMRGLTDAPTRPARRWHELPAIQSIVRGEPKSSQWVTDFFDAVNKAEAMQKKIKDLNETGRPSDAREADELMREHRALLASRKELLTTRRTLADLRKQSDAIMRGNLSPELKRQRIDEINRRRLKEDEDAIKWAKAKERLMQRRA